MKKLMTAAALATLLTGCVTFPTQESDQVKVIWDDVNAIANCQHLGTVMGSEGHFTTTGCTQIKTWFGNTKPMRIKAAELGADTLYLYQPLGFSSSVTMFANAY